MHRKQSLPYIHPNVESGIIRTFLRKRNKSIPLCISHPWSFPSTLKSKFLASIHFTNSWGFELKHIHLPSAARIGMARKSFQWNKEARARCVSIRGGLEKLAHKRHFNILCKPRRSREERKKEEKEARKMRYATDLIPGIAFFYVCIISICYFCKFCGVYWSSSAYYPSSILHYPLFSLRQFLIKLLRKDLFITFITYFLKIFRVKDGSSEIVKSSRYLLLFNLLCITL